jgi:membrane protein DedA with SNARE-associated domain/membrane-associated phospholipid phosphatase
MVDGVRDITAAIAAHPGLAHGAVLALALLKSLPVLGAAAPAGVAIIATAALVPTGAVTVGPLLAAAVAGAILGDGLLYWLGRRHHAAILACWPLARHPRLVDHSRGLIVRHGGKSILLARFTPALRGIIPVMAGILEMPARRFHAASAIAALLWATALIVPGLLLGTSLALAGAAAGRLALLLLLLIVLLWAATGALRLALGRGLAFVAAAGQRLRAWSAAQDGWLARQVRALVDEERNELRALLMWAAVVIGAAALFLGTLDAVAGGEPLVRIDAVVYRALQELRTPAGDAVMIAVTEFGDTFVTTSVTVVVLLWLLWQRAWRTAAYWLAAIGFAATLNTITKLAIHRARPSDLAYAGASAFSFPSGHATVNLVLYGSLAFLIALALRPVWRLPVAAVAACAGLLMAFSRLYLGAHWFSDVIGSLAFATAWLVVLGLAYVRHHDRPFSRGQLALVACGALALFGGFNVMRHHAADVARYAVRDTTPSLAAQAWWAGAWHLLPAHRIDLTGDEEEPLAFQWAGSLDGLEHRLTASGWRAPVPWTTAGTLAWLVTADPRELPVVPWLDAGRLPSRMLIRAADDSAGTRLVLRLWPADQEISGVMPQPLWLGSVVEEQIVRPLSFTSIAWTKPDTRRPLERLAQSLGGARLAQRDRDAGRGDRHVLLAHEDLAELAREKAQTER